jgi:hypothetical protein
MLRKPSRTSSSGPWRNWPPESACWINSDVSQIDTGIGNAWLSRLLPSANPDDDAIVDGVQLLVADGQATGRQVLANHMPPGVEQVAQRFGDRTLRCGALLVRLADDIVEARRCSTTSRGRRTARASGCRTG